MRGPHRHKGYKRALSLALSLQVALLALPAMADSNFGDNWQPKPLVDTSKAQPVTPPAAGTAPSTAVATQPAQPEAPRLEEVLKPALPFIESVEAQLNVKPAPGDLLANRLNNLQKILFGEVKYTDAGELLAKMAEIFPSEAAKARADLLAQMQKDMLKPSDQAQPATKNGKPTVVAHQGNPSIASMTDVPPGQVIVPYQGMQVVQQAPVQQPPKKAKKKKDSFWGDDDEFFSDNWDNSDDFAQSAPQQQSSRGSGLRNLGAGLGSLAMIAGSLAGSYYLNKKMGGDNNTPYYRDPYGSPYTYGGYAPQYGYPGYGAPGYAAPGYAPPGYNNYYGTPQYGYGAQQYGYPQAGSRPPGYGTRYYPQQQYTWGTPY